MPDQHTMSVSFPIADRVRRGVLIATIITIVLTSGCRQELNRSHTLYGDALLPALDTEQALTLPASEASVTRGHDRRHWPLTTVTLPARQVEHHPSYVFLVQCTDHTARQRGEAPTVASALETEPRSLVHAVETIVDLAQAAVLPVSIPVQMMVLFRLPWTVECGPAPAAPPTAPPNAGDPARWWTASPAPDAAAGNR